MYTNSREEEVVLLKRLWAAQPTTCPKCNQAILEHLHKKAKKSNCDWICKSCGKRYDTIKILDRLNDLNFHN